MTIWNILFYNVSCKIYTKLCLDLIISAILIGNYDYSYACGVALRDMNERTLHLLFNVSWSSHSWDTAISKFEHENPWPRPRVWIRSRPHCWLSNQSIYFLFVSHQSTLAFLRYNFLNIWRWKTMIMVMTKVKTNDYIWGLVFNRIIFS